MRGLLLDTRLLKHLAPGEGGRNCSFRDFVCNSAQPIFLSIILVVDIKARIQKVCSTRQEARADALDAWLEGIVANYGDRIYPVDAEVAMCAGELMNRSRAFAARNFSDLLLAATARVHNHALVTERKSDFVSMNSGIELWDPFD